MGERIPGSTCGFQLGADWIDCGTLALSRFEAQGATHARNTPAQSSPADSRYYYSDAYKVVVDVPFSIAPHMTWDAYWRLIYDKTAAGLQRQANLLRQRGAVTLEEARRLVDARNELLLKIRSRLSPFGELYSELEKPAASLKNIDTLVKEKGSIQAVISSVGKTRQVVDRIAVATRVAGPATIVLEVSITAIVIQAAPPEERGRVAAREIGGAVGGVGFGIAGAWAGCVTGAAFASWSLVVPIIGEGATGTACLVGGIIGGMGIGYAGRRAGETAGTQMYEWSTHVSDFAWVLP